MNISKEKLNEIIESHGKWLRGEKGGNYAYLSYADLRGAYLSGAYLSGADLSGADLDGACLDKTYYQITRIGGRKGTTTYCVEDDNVTCGCWNEYKGGTLQEFKARVESVYGTKGITPNEKYYTEYIAAIKFFEKVRGVEK
jgi:hypothetical protein